MVDFDQIQNNDDLVKSESLEELKAVAAAFGIDDVDNEGALLLDNVTLLPELFDNPNSVDVIEIELPKAGEFICPNCNLVAWASYARHVQQEQGLPAGSQLVCADCVVDVAASTLPSKMVKLALAA